MSRNHSSGTGPGQSPLDPYLRQIDETPLLTAEDEQDLAYQVQDGDPEARDHMVRANLRLVVKIAREYTGRGVCMQDLIAEGNMGLMRAVEAFDPGRNVRFSTYASFWIKQSIRRMVTRMSRTVRLPDYMARLVRDWHKTALRLEGELGRKPAEEEIAVALELRPRQVAAIKKASRIFTAIPEGTLEEDDTRLEGLICDKRHPTPPDAVSSSEDVRQVLDLLNQLELRAATVLRLRFGLGGGEPLSLQQVGDHIGLTRERTRQIEQKALRKLQELMEVDE